jgi:hypothetical protein
MIFEFSLRNENKSVSARGILRNMLTYALGDRLHNIKNALPTFQKSSLKGRGPTSTAGMSAVARPEIGRVRVT